MAGFLELALQTAGSRAQDAIKRLDCGTQPMGLMSDEPRWFLEALDCGSGLGNERSASWAQFLMVPAADCKGLMRQLS